MIGYTVTSNLDFWYYQIVMPNTTVHVAQRRWNFLWINNIPPSENAESRLMESLRTEQEKRIRHNCMAGQGTR